MCTHIYILFYRHLLHIKNPSYCVKVKSSQNKRINNNPVTSSVFTVYEPYKGTQQYPDVPNISPATHPRYPAKHVLMLGLHRSREGLENGLQGEMAKMTVAWELVGKISFSNIAHQVISHS